MKKTKRIISIIIAVALVATICAMSTFSSGASGTGTGLAEWALNAYYSKWSYVYGGASAGAVDCSGLIYSYAGGHRVGDAQMGNSSYTGSVGSGIPNIHGLGLYQPGHVGVYVGNGMAVDARGDDYGVCYESAYSHNWTIYFKVPGVSYPTSGWVKFNGDYYYYENGEYLSDTSKTIDGTTYYFSSSGASSKTPSDTSSKSNSSSSSSSSSSSDSSSKTLRNGSQGEKVEKLQKRLCDLGYYNGAIDGDFGNQTEKAFMLFQEAMGLAADGIAGSDVEYLYSDNAVKYENSNIIKKKSFDLASTAAQEDKASTEESEKTNEEINFQKGDNSETIVNIQERLTDLEYYKGDLDGSFGAQTETAVKTFQGANGITQSGVVDDFTYNMIFSEEAVKNPVDKLNTAKIEEKAANAETQTATTSPSTVAVSNTEVALQTNELSSKALAGVADNLGFQYNSNATNFQFILWLAIMIVVMLLSFIVVYAIEKKRRKKQAAKHFHRYA